MSYPVGGSGTILSHLPVPAAGGPRVDLTLGTHQLLFSALSCFVLQKWQAWERARLEVVPLVRGWG